MKIENRSPFMLDHFLSTLITVTSSNIFPIQSTKDSSLLTSGKSNLRKAIEDAIFESPSPSSSVTTTTTTTVFKACNKDSVFIRHVESPGAPFHRPPKKLVEIQFPEPFGQLPVSCAIGTAHSEPRGKNCEEKL